MTFDTRKGAKDYTDPATVRKDRKRYQVADQETADDLQAVLNTPQGRRVLWRILEHSKLLAPDMFTGNSTTFHNLGRRDEGLWLYNEIVSVDPDKFIDMMKLQLKDNTDD